MIQIIKYKKYPNYSTKDVEINDFSNYKSFNLYDVNIICLNENDMWVSKGSNYNLMSCSDDLCKLKKTIKTSKTKTVIILPSNSLFRYNLLDTLQNMLIQLLYDNIPNFEYEPGYANVNDIKYNYDFYFENVNDNILLKAEKSDKVVAIKYENVIVTTLQLLINKDFEKPLNNLLSVFYKDELDNTPNWINDILFYDDQKYLDDNKTLEKKITEIHNKIKQNNKKLETNSHYKSILFQTGDYLKNVIIEMIEVILNEKNDFKDEFEEDYLFKSNGYSFVVETKGLNGEVQGKHVTDAFSHLIIYEDKLEKSGIEENTKCLFFVASERNIIPSERKKINERHVTIAKRNNTLIIDTPTFLKIYEDFLNDKINKNEIISIFIKQFGIINYKSR